MWIRNKPAWKTPTTLMVLLNCMMQIHSRGKHSVCEFESFRDVTKKIKTHSNGRQSILKHLKPLKRRKLELLWICNNLVCCRWHSRKARADPLLLPRAACWWSNPWGTHGLLQRERGKNHLHMLKQWKEAKSEQLNTDCSSRKIPWGPHEIAHQPNKDK